MDIIKKILIFFIILLIIILYLIAFAANVYFNENFRYRYYYKYLDFDGRWLLSSYCYKIDDGRKFCRDVKDIYEVQDFIYVKERK